MPASQVASSNLQNEWTANSTTVPGQLGNMLSFSNANVKRPLYHSFQASVSGTAPSACTFQAEFSLNGLDWVPFTLVDDAENPEANPIDASAGAFGTTGFGGIIPFTFLRINLVAFVPGDATTVVKFYWTGAGQ